MNSLLDLQKRVATAVMQPLTGGDRMRRKSLTGQSVTAEAEAFIKPNAVLSSFERLEIYNRQYWFRILSCFSEDFPGLRAIVGPRQFDGLMRQYLADCPSVSFTLRNLGSRLETWLRSHTDWIEPMGSIALDMVRLEWAHIEAFDGGCEPSLTPADLEADGLEENLFLQPYIRLIELKYAVDDLLIEVHNYEGETDTSSNSAHTRQLKRRVRKYGQPERERIYLAVHRSEDSVYYKRLEAEAFRLLKTLNKTRSLEISASAAFEHSSMSDDERLTSLQTWFANWAELGWFCGPAKRNSFSIPA